MNNISSLIVASITILSTPMAQAAQFGVGNNIGTSQLPATMVVESKDSGVTTPLTTTVTYGAQTDDPPPPQGPPVAGPGAASSIYWYRQAVYDAANNMLIDRNYPTTVLGVPCTDINEPEHGCTKPADTKLRWAPHSKPTECGYDCMGPPILTATEWLDRPNNRIVKVDGHLTFEGSKYGVTRRITTNYSLIFSCEGWRDGSGELNLTTRFQRPFIDDDGGWDGGWLENIVDFIALPGNLSRYVDALIHSQLSTPGETERGLFPCRSLGAESHYGSGAYSSDQIISDPPEPLTNVSYNPPVSATVVINSMTRKSTQTISDTSAYVTFNFYANGMGFNTPVLTEVQIAPGETLNLQHTGFTIPIYGDTDSFQLIVSDSLGGAAWQQFSADSGYGDGNHTLLTHRIEVQPADSLQGTGKNPVTVDIREFEISYTVYAGLVLELETADPSGMGDTVSP